MKKIETIFQKYSTPIISLLAVLLLLPAIYWMIQQNVFPLPYLSLTSIHIISLFFFECLLAAILCKVYFGYAAEQRSAVMVHLFFWFFFINTIVYQPFYSYYTSPERLQYPVIKKLGAGLTIFRYILLLATIILFFVNRYDKKVVRFILEVDPFLDKIFSQDVAPNQPDQVKGSDQNLIRKMLSENRLTVIILSIAFIVGFAIRMFHLDGFEPYVDEYIHLNAARQMLLGETATYRRAFVLVTLPVYLSFKIFGMSIWAARLPGVIVNMLAIFPLYTLGKRISPKIGIIAVLLYVVSPWIIAVSRTVREYAYMPFFMFLSANFLLDLLKWEGLKVKEYLWKNKFQFLILLAIFIYAYIDRESPFIIIYILFALFIPLAILQILKQKRLNIQSIIILILNLLLLIFFLNKVSLFASIPSRLISTAKFWNAITSSDFRQWYPIPGVAYLLLFIPAQYSLYSLFTHWHKHKAATIFTVLTFCFVLIYMSFFLIYTGVALRLRYGILAEYWYVPLVAFSIYTIYLLIQRVVPQKFSWVTIIILASLLINGDGIWLAISYTGGGMYKMTHEKHYSVDEAIEFIAPRLTQEDILITSILDNYDQITSNRLHPKAIISTIGIGGDKNDSIRTLILQNPQGWIAIIPNPSERVPILPDKDILIDGKFVHYYGLFGDIKIWGWSDK